MSNKSEAYFASIRYLRASVNSFGTGVDFRLSGVPESRYYFEASKMAQTIHEALICMAVISNEEGGKFDPNEAKQFKLGTL